MSTPGLSFEIVRASAPSLGLRTDRTAIIALTQRGPVETPVLVHGHDELVERFGCAMDGTLGALAARGYFDNGGEELIVTRFVTTSAEPASALVGTVGLITPITLPLAASSPGRFGDDVEIDVIHSLRRRAKGSIDTIFTPADLDRPVHVVAAAIDRWGHVNPSDLSFVPAGAAVPAGTTVVAEIYEPTFSLRIREPGRRDVIVSGLDLRDLAGARAKLAGTSVTIAGDPADADGVGLPIGGRVRLAGGKDGLDIPGTDEGIAIEVEELADSFRRCIRALESSDLPDVVIAPDLWSRIWLTKGKRRLAFDGVTAAALADEMARSAARARDRVVLLDPPLLGKDELRPAGVSELAAWSEERRNNLGEDRDFVAAFTPWARIIAGGRYRNDDTLLVPPSAYVAGRMARTARERGSWISTGNVSLERVIGLSARLSIADQETLQDLGISPLRMEIPQGATIQGVRSLAWPDRPSWGFLSTRRLFNYLRRALRPIGLSYTFEPNAPSTWAALRRDVTRLLRDLFDRGAFAGAQPNEAFFIKIDEALNPEDARDGGVMTAQIGVAPAAPLEFLVVKLILQGGTARLAEEVV